MKYFTNNSINKPFSYIIYGCANELFLKGTVDFSFLDQINKLGINAFDTARIYGKSEEVLGNWIKERKNREDIIIISKCCHPIKNEKYCITKEWMYSDLSASLKCLQTQYIDIYELHRDDFNDVSTVVETFNEMISQNKIKAYGLSNWKVERINEAIEYANEHKLVPPLVSSPSYNILDRKICDFDLNAVSISGKENEYQRQWYINNKMLVFGYSAFASGYVFTKSGNKFVIRNYHSNSNDTRLDKINEFCLKESIKVSDVCLLFFFLSEMDIYPILTTLSFDKIKSYVKCVDFLIEKFKDKISFLSFLKSV